MQVMWRKGKDEGVLGIEGRKKEYAKKSEKG